MELRVGLTIGIKAAICSSGGAWIARLADPQVGTELFAAFLVVSAVIVPRRSRRAVPRNEATDGEVA